MKMKTAFLILVVAAIAAGGVYWKLKQRQDEEQVQKYDTVKAGPGRIEITVAFGHGDRSRCGFRVMQIADRSRDLLFHVRA